MSGIGLIPDRLSCRSAQERIPAVHIFHRFSVRYRSSLSIDLAVLLSVVAI
jgi:hypothetical protein